MPFKKKTKKRKPLQNMQSALPTKKELNDHIIQLTQLIDSEDATYDQKIDACGKRREDRKKLAQLERRVVTLEEKIEDDMQARFFEVYAEHERQQSNIRQHLPLATPKVISYPFLSKAEEHFQAGQAKVKEGEPTKNIILYEQAKNHYIKSLEYNIGHIQARRSLINVRLLLNLEREAIADCEWLLQIPEAVYQEEYASIYGSYQQHRYDVYCQYACIQMNLRNITDAQSLFEKARAMNVNASAAYIGLGKLSEILAEEEKKHAWNVSVCFLGTKKANLFFLPSAFQGMTLVQRIAVYDGYVVAMQEKYKEAKEYYDRAIRIDPYSIECHIARERLHREIKTAYLSVLSGYDEFVKIYQGLRDFNQASVLCEKALVFARTNGLESEEALQKRAEKLVILRQLATRAQHTDSDKTIVRTTGLSLAL